MAPPTKTDRTIPGTGTYKLPDGYQTTIAFQTYPGIAFWEITVQPPGIDGGEPVQNTTMLNSTWRTMRARKLKTLSPIKVTAAYDPDAVYQTDFVSGSIYNMINVETSITVHFPDNSYIAFYGYLQKAEPKENKEGEMPELDLTIVPTNWDPAANVEAAPLYHGATGT